MMQRMPSNRPWETGLRWALAMGLVLVAVASGCSRMARKPPVRLEVYEEVEARRTAFEGFSARAHLTLEHKADLMEIPLEVTVTDDLVIEARGEISYFLLPFSGEVRLVSSEDATLLHTNIGTYDLATDPQVQAGARAFLLSLVGGGDWLVWWLAGEACEAGPDTQCMGLEIVLEPDGGLSSITAWQISEPSMGATFKARVDEFEPGTMQPRTISGIIQPQEIAVYMKYSEISRQPGEAR